MVKRVKYTCKNCGWQTSIREAWGDIKPKRCMNKKCNTSFIASPESLVIDRPKKDVKKSVTPSDTVPNKAETGNVTKSKKGRSRNTVQQQTKKKDSE